MVGRGLLEVDLGDPDAALGGAELGHVGDDLDLGDDLVLLDPLAGLLVELGDDPADLRLDVHLVPRLDLAGDDGPFLEVRHGRDEFLIAGLLRLRPLEQVDEGSDDGEGEKRESQILQYFFHML